MYEVTAGAASQLIDVFVQDSSLTTGAGLTGLVYNTAGLTCYYKRQGASSWTAVSLATMTQGTWATGGFIVGDGTNAPGMYEFGIPDAAIASAAGVNWVDFMFKGATNMAPAPLRIMLKKVDLQDTVRAGLTALPNAAAEASGGLYTRGTGAGQINQDANGRVDINLKAILGTALTETAGLLAAGFKKFFNVATPTGTVNSIPDAVAGATGGISIVGSAMALTSGERTTTTAVILNTVNTGATFNVANSVGRQIRTASGSAISIRTGTCQAGSTANSIKLDSGASSTNNLYQGAKAVITGGTGVGQQRNVIAYSGSTKLCTVDKAWVVTPDNTSTFDLQLGTLSITSTEGTAQAGGASSITLATTAVATTSYYVPALVTILGGTGSGQTREITAYSSGRVATVDSAWSVAPDNTSVYAVIPSGGTTSDNAPAPPTATEISSTLLATALTQHDVSALTTNTVEDALSSSRAQGGGAWILTGTALTLKNPDGTTFRSFTLDSATAPTSRT